MNPGAESEFIGPCLACGKPTTGAFCDACDSDDGEGDAEPTPMNEQRSMSTARVRRLRRMLGYHKRHLMVAESRAMGLPDWKPISRNQDRRAQRIFDKRLGLIP